GRCRCAVGIGRSTTIHQYNGAPREIRYKPAVASYQIHDGTVLSAGCYCTTLLHNSPDVYPPDCIRFYHEIDHVQPFLAWIDIRPAGCLFDVRASVQLSCESCRVADLQTARRPFARFLDHVSDRRRTIAETHLES